MSSAKNEDWRLTCIAYLGHRLLGLPFWSLINLLAFILYKNLHITPLQITFIIALKPTSALLAPYWSQIIHQHPERVIRQLMVANVCRYLPFLFIPWFDSAWPIIGAFGVNMMLYRASMPSWMEIIKCNLPKAIQERTLAYGCMFDYSGTAFMTLILGFVLDHYGPFWRWLFVATALLGLISTLLLYKLSRTDLALPPQVNENANNNFKETLLRPWKQTWQLLKERPDFRIFQMGFMLGGGGLMVIQPALPAFFVDVLQLSYTEMGMALAVCKGIGCGLTAQLWTRIFQKMNIYQFSSLVTLLAGLFPILLLLAPINVLLLYIAYILYGIMQAGSEFSWHISGLVFAKEQDSSIFSRTNVLTVGLRGCVIPALGASLLPLIYSSGVMLLGGALCFSATGYLMQRSPHVLKQKI